MLMMGGYFGDGMGWFGFGFGWIATILFWGFVIWGILAVVHALTGRGSCRGYCGGPSYHGGENVHEGNRALDILKERYAKGEISKEDFDRMKEDVQ